MFLALFEGIVVSGEEYIKKPDPAIFQLLMDRYDLNPDTTLFIDDNQNNIASAQNLGFKTVHFLSAMEGIGKIKDCLMY